MDLQDPRDMARAGLLEPKVPAMQWTIPCHNVFVRGHRNRAIQVSSLEPSSRWAMRNDLVQGTELGAYVALHARRQTDSPPRTSPRHRVEHRGQIQGGVSGPRGVLPAGTQPE